jgi:hypothetical protein
MVAHGEASRTHQGSIHRSAWKKCSANFTFIAFSEVRGLPVLGYYELDMLRAFHSVVVAFWIGVPLLAVALAASWPRRDLGWPAEALWLVVVASSAFLTFRAFAPVAGEGGRGEARWAWESLVYPITLALALLPVALQIYS